MVVFLRGYREGLTTVSSVISQESFRGRGKKVIFQGLNFYVLEEMLIIYLNIPKVEIYTANGRLACSLWR